MTKGLQVIHRGKLLHVRLVGELTKQLCESMELLINQQVQQYGRIAVVAEIQGFRGLARSEELGDVEFEVGSWNGIVQLALVGEPKWALTLALLCRPLTCARIRHFEVGAVDAANRWVSAM